ncbi:MAG: hypothetical protein RSG77_24650, partial [Hafnia sp.]
MKRGPSMKEIQEVIRLVHESLDSGLATSERFDQNNSLRQSFIRYHVGENAQYVAEVSGNEPAEISIARRLMQGNLNLNYVSQDEAVKPEMIETLKKIHALSVEAGIDFGKHGADLAFAHVIPQLYTKEVLVFQNNVVITTDDVQKAYFDNDKLDSTKKMALNAAYADEPLLALDAMGAYRPVMKLTVPDLFDPSDTLKAIKRADFSGTKGLEQYAKIEFLEGVDPSTLKAVGDSAVMRMDGVDYRSIWDAIQV